MLTAIAIDDEPIALNIIRTMAADIPFIQLAHTFTNAFTAIAWLQQHPVHLVFLDIRMPDISGTDVLPSLPGAPMVIFTTAYSEHAVQSFELDAIDYLLKPFSEERFLKACTKAQRLHTMAVTCPPAPPLFVKSGAEQLRIATEAILYVESQGNYIQFVLEERKITCRLTMAEAASLLPQTHFVRIHRSYIASIKYITRMDKNQVWIKEIPLPVGPSYAAAVNAILQ